MTLLRIDSIGGASGNMLLGALMGLGVDRERLVTALRGLPIEGFDLVTREVKQHGHVGLHVEVEVVDVPHPHRGLAAITQIIESSELPERVRSLSLAVFRRLAEAEAEVHGTTAEAVHFHEVGAMDAIVDIVGCCLCLDRLGIDAVACGALPVGCGTVEAAHGILPLPVPATAVLLKGFDVTPTDLPFEMVTPTGAALLTTWQNELAAGSGAGGVAGATANGFGSRELPDRPNMLRAMLMDTAADDGPALNCWVMECNLDDMSPELIGSLCGRLSAAGALDVFTTPVQMKKQRPGVVLTILCGAGEREALLDLVFTESTTFGVREYPVTRRVLERELVPVQTPYGQIHVKLGRWKGAIVTRAPEYEDCTAAADAHGAPVKVVYEVALKSLERSLGNE
ncbi:MAG: nickel pincer cofactor biosynthesis protein LarC [Verrucomicrobia bacterium]|jgi:pyridinium-3,5-bisthiocarboxylic acid mononucleotide nickel chelatase|nr:nickel pincer cofactor biosynthesis protein LarC [Verrucomicrobiota bacterium]MBT7068141.1 nickel pincer cofactor biosynthesis protein LarC [Verrucomicrobiota bacterium]MBT7699059.1 nickel pincer cofactor biosynthesis protein LarC [Verrucomicrobiota bacterium]